MTEKKKENGMTCREFVKTVGGAAVVGSALSMSVPKEAHAARTLKIGFMGPFTGPASRTGDQFKRGIKWPWKTPKQMARSLSKYTAPAFRTHT